MSDDRTADLSPDDGHGREGTIPAGPSGVGLGAGEGEGTTFEPEEDAPHDAAADGDDLGAAGHA